MRECSHNGKYLGSPFCNFTDKATTFSYIAEKLARNLSMVGRNTLIKSMALVIPSYIMQAFLLPVSLCDRLDRLSRRFLWRVQKDGERYLALWAWDNICTSKQVGGLGIRRARDMNIAYVMKLA